MENKEEVIDNIPSRNTGITIDKAEFQLVVGKRLAEIRNAIKPKLSQVRLANYTNLNQNIIQRIETGGGTIDNLLVMLNYYLKEDYNLNYILAEDNSVFTEKLRPQDKVENINDYFELPE
ncbi:hypothetical protein [Adhaeribacter rhizoryzae]|uniref:XRE family transcriptional regulator n=1 Tax=Adhaeribacter rhizoryzae TaxID=2607907 RepID=A0A5M6D5G1_9BACT|nr:hypothetical protein [Adhaeribacter rhizoryzae]KAA5541986.1 hypothetical protein F0145_19560 [Adhaeribacter rhizoryzae]